MERKIKQEVEIKDIVFDEELYPRSLYSWRVAHKYSETMKTGVEFPPITLAILDGRMVLIDGKHRLEATKSLKKETINAEVFTGWSRQKAFEEAIQRNLHHGQNLSIFDRRRIALRLRNSKYRNKHIARILQIPQESVDSFIGQRLVNTITGETIVKTSLKHLAGTRYEGDIEPIQKKVSNPSHVHLIEELITLLEENLLNIEDDKVREKLERLKELLI